MTFQDFLSYHYIHNKAFLLSVVILTPLQLIIGVLSMRSKEEIGQITFWNVSKLIPLLCDITSTAILVYKQPKNKLRRFFLIGFVFSLIGNASFYVN
jgi:hypothetical protein